MGRLYTLTLIGWTLAGALARAQSFDLEMTPRGTSEFEIRLEARDTPALDILSALAARTGRELTPTGPGLTQKLDEERLDVDVAGVTVDELVTLLTGACGLAARVDDEAGRIVVTDLPEPDDEGAAEFFRKEALAALIRAFGGDEDDEREIQLLLRSAELYLSGGDYASAYDSLEKFVNNYKGHERAPEACLRAGRAALAAGRLRDAKRMADLYIDDYARQNGQAKAQILAARVLLEEKNVPHATSILESVVRERGLGEVDERDGVVAELLLANVHYDLGDYAAAVSVLQQVPWRHDRTKNVDLLGQVPLYLGLSRRGMGDLRRAVDDLKLGAYTCPTPELRIRSLLEQARTFLAMESPFEALSAVRVAAALEPEGATLVETRHLEALAFRDLDLDSRAVERLIETVLALGELVPDPARRRALAAELMQDVGAILFSIGEWDDALAAFERLRRDPELAAEAGYMMALCEFRADRFKEALARLDRIPVDGAADKAFLTKVRRLRGDCYMRLRMFEKAVRIWRREHER